MPDRDGSRHAAVKHVVSALRTALVGRAVLRFDGPGVDGPAPSLGRVVEEVNRRGRTIQIVWDDGLILSTRLGLMGVWHLYREGEPWHKPFTQVRVAITVPGWVAVCFRAPFVETYREFDRQRHPGFGRTAPDLAAHHPDVTGCARRLHGYAEPDAPVVDALVDPHVASGIGNVHRCETLWRCALHPFARVGDLSPAECVRLFETAASLLRRNADYARSAAPVDSRDELVVYGRNGQRCDRCGDTIQVCRIGEHHRMLYWCSGCQTDHAPQPVGDEPAADDLEVAAEPSWHRDVAG